MGENKQEKYYSWGIQRSSIAYKKIDKSFYSYGETIIPIDVRNFFGIDKLSYGDIVDIILNYRGIDYESNIIFENNFNRCKLSLKSLLKKEVQATIDGSICKGCYESENVYVVFIKEGSNRYNMSLSVEI